MEAIKAKVFALKLSAVGSLLATGSVATAFIIPAEAPKGWQEGLHTAAICTIVIGGIMSFLGKLILSWIKADEEANAALKAQPIVTTTVSMMAVIALGSVLSGCSTIAPCEAATIVTDRCISNGPNEQKCERCEGEKTPTYKVNHEK